MDHEECDCGVCCALRETGLQVFRLSWQTNDELNNWNYFGFDKSEEEFGDAVKAAKSKIDDLACTREELWDVVNDVLKEHGFESTMKWETSWMWITERPPIVRGFTFEIEME